MRSLVTTQRGLDRAVRVRRAGRVGVWEWVNGMSDTGGIGSRGAERVVHGRGLRPTGAGALGRLGRRVVHDSQLGAVSVSAGPARGHELSAGPRASGPERARLRRLRPRPRPHTPSARPTAYSPRRRKPRRRIPTRVRALRRIAIADFARDWFIPHRRGPGRLL